MIPPFGVKIIIKVVSISLYFLIVRFCVQQIHLFLLIENSIHIFLRDDIAQRHLQPAAIPFPPI